MNTCKIVEDLLPLYIEDLAQAETTEFVRGHLAECGRCAAVYRRMSMPVEQQTPESYKKSLRKGLWGWTWRIVLGLVLAICLPLYFFWEIGAFGERKAIRSDVSGKEFVVVDMSRAGLFQRGGAYVITPDGRGRNLKGRQDFQELEIQWAPDGETYFAWWKFEDSSESYFWGDTSVMEPDEDGTVSYSYEDRKWPESRNFVDRMTACVETHEGLQGLDLGEITFTFDMWSLDSERIYFTFETENGYGGRVKFDCVSKEFTLQRSYRIIVREMQMPLEVIRDIEAQAGSDAPAGS